MIIEKENICAISSPAGVGAISIIRISGGNSFEITSKIVSSQDKFIQLEAKKMLFTSLVKPNGDILDEVIVAKFISPNSYTGEDMVEIYCHGSEYIQREILHLLISNGASAANAGEFTQRAFMNGKMDLSQSEAVADLISSSTRESHKLAMNQMKGKISDEISLLRNKMLELISLLELELDFGEEDVEFADRSDLLKLSNELNTKILKLIDSFIYGNAIKEGVPVSIVGKPNAGKSTLLNALLEDDRAIVSSTPGTTRDTIEEILIIDGIKFRLIDTAGIRSSDDEIEQMGVERTMQKIEHSNIVVLLIDATDLIESNLEFIEELTKSIDDDSLVIVAINKTDITDINELDYNFQNTILISAKTKINIDKLCNIMSAHVKSLKQSESDTIITNTRHVELFYKSSEALQRANDALKNDISGDFVAQDLREAMYFLGEITGHISNEEVLGSIFAKFCIGK